MEIYLVGGAVRDKLLNLTSHDRDWLVVGSTPEQMLTLNYKAVGQDFPVFLHPETGEEYALARTERKSGTGYKGFACYAAPDVTLEQDLSRRDLTINAIAEDSRGQLHDPFNGITDLNNRVLRHISDAFTEDPLRVLRVARFAAKLAKQGFTIAPETLILMRKMAQSGELTRLTAERVWQEFNRALCTSDAPIFIEALRACGALAVLFPEIDNLFGVPNPPQWHPEIDSGIHTLLALTRACLLTEDPVIRFAVLVHDLGKALTPKSSWPSHKGHAENGVPLIREFCQRYRVPKPYQQMAELVGKYHIRCHQCQEFTEKGLLKLLDGLDAFRRPERLAPVLLACQADVQGRPGQEQNPYPQQAYLMKIFTAAAAVDQQAIIQALTKQARQSGEQIKQAIHRARLQAIKALLQSGVD